MKYITIAAMLLGCSITTSAEVNNWMSVLPSETPVRKLSIPGAHDAGTGNGFTSDSQFLASIAGVTQKLTIEEQWDAGVRAFDLRPAYKSDGTLQIYHGVLETNLSFREAVETLRAKLADNPGEFAVIIMRHEDDSDSNAAGWAPAVAAVFDEFDSTIATFSPAMTVGDARGKIIVLTRDKFTSSKSGEISGWSHSENFSNQQNGIISRGRNKAKLYTQDFYECGTTDRKIKALTAMLDYSIENTDGTVWVINHTSGYTGSMGTNAAIKELAAASNPATTDYLATHGAGRTGIVLMDFAGVDEEGGTAVGGKKLLDAIIAQNATYIDLSAILEVAENVAESYDAVYNLTGIRVANGTESLSSLSPGIYIVNGKKIRVK